MVVTLHRVLTVETDINPKLQQMAQAANVLMGMVAQNQQWAIDVLTTEHLEAGKITHGDGTALTPEELAFFKGVFAAFDSLRVAANTNGPNGEPSVGKRVRPFV